MLPLREAGRSGIGRERFRPSPCDARQFASRLVGFLVGDDEGVSGVPGLTLSNQCCCATWVK